MVRGKKGLQLGTKIEANVKATIKREELEIPFSVTGSYKYLGFETNKREQTQKWVRTIYAASSRCVNNTTIRADQCSLHVRRILFNSYVIGSMVYLSCVSRLDKKVVTAYRYAVLRFWGNIRSINIKNVNNKVTRTSTLVARAGILSVGELHRKCCYSLYIRMRDVKNSVINQYAHFALYKEITAFAL